MILKVHLYGHRGDRQTIDIVDQGLLWTDIKREIWLSMFIITYASKCANVNLFFYVCFVFVYRWVVHAGGNSGSNAQVILTIGFGQNVWNTNSLISKHWTDVFISQYSISPHFERRHDTWSVCKQINQHTERTKDKIHIDLLLKAV